MVVYVIDIGRLSPGRIPVGSPGMPRWRRWRCCLRSRRGKPRPIRGKKLVGALVAIFFIFPLILGCESSQLTNSYFSEGWPWPTNQEALEHLWRNQAPGSAFALLTLGWRCSELTYIRGGSEKIAEPLCSTCERHVLLQILVILVYHVYHVYTIYNI